jgi:hypothetical protein
VLEQGGLGKDGKYKTNVMQALHGLRNLQKYHESKEWPKLWSTAAAKCGFDLTNFQPIKLQPPSSQGGGQLGSAPHLS